MVGGMLGAFTSKYVVDFFGRKNITFLKIFIEINKLQEILLNFYLDESWFCELEIRKIIK